MPEYRIHFTWKEKKRVLKCRELDMTHPYFVALDGLLFPEASTVIIGPDDDELRREFGEAKTIMIPFQNVHLIETLADTTPVGNVDTAEEKVIRFEKRNPNEHE